MFRSLVVYERAAPAQPLASRRVLPCNLDGAAQALGACPGADTVKAADATPKVATRFSQTSSLPLLAWQAK